MSLGEGMRPRMCNSIFVNSWEAFHCANIPHFHLPFIWWLTCRPFCHALVILHNSILSLKTSHTYVTECGKLNLMLNWKIYPLWTSVGRCYSCYQRRQEIINLTQLQTLEATILPCLKAATGTIIAQDMGVTNDCFKKWDLRPPPWKGVQTC